ncbi:hypothetical protein NP493_426g01057 [Ridgeia piscesae]|uniref:Uncharacterized protein n=1 Tax=Ridgeia piscesae TaxID=27915 RepID=A0AAD9NV87_RIDPI|nr:hypothetical protein NP493_426g01057 [Ridgeia piscesae]
MARRRVSPTRWRGDNRAQLRRRSSLIATRRACRVVCHTRFRSDDETRHASRRHVIARQLDPGGLHTPPPTPVSSAQPCRNAIDTFPPTIPGAACTHAGVSSTYRCLPVTSHDGNVPV